MSLVALSRIIGDTPLYMVGGAVRNMLIGVPAHDIDITASMRAEEVIERLRGSEFEVIPSSLRMGTLIIKDGDERYEYTAFRSDSYPLGSGVHTPTDVVFTDDILLDAKRRDFTVNAIYYDVMKETYVDPLGVGIDDIKRRILRTTREPEEVFGEDGLRLLRLVRFYAELGFEVDEQCYAVAKTLVHLLKDISVERIEDEFSKILVADTAVYHNENGHYKGMKMLIDIGAMRYIIPELLEGAGVKQNPLYHKVDVLTHILDAYRISDPSIRLAALMHDIGKPYEQREHGNMYAHNVSGACIAREALTRLRYPVKVIDEVTRLVYIHMFNLKSDAKISTVKKFIVANHDIMDKFLMLRWADVMSSTQNIDSYNSIKAIYDEMKRNKVPMTLGELAVNGNDLIACGYKGVEIGEKLHSILIDVALGRLSNTKEEIMRSMRGGRCNQKQL